MFEIDRVNKVITIDIKIAPEFLIAILFVYLFVKFVMYVQRNNCCEKIFKRCKDMVFNIIDKLK